MRNFTCLLLVLLFFSSCSVYQYTTISGTDISQNEQKEFVSENDSLKIVYNFNGYNCPVNITVYNKSAKPLYIDWKKSAVISNGQAASYYSPGFKVNGAINGYNIDWANGFSNQNSNISANINGQEGMQFIPPQAFITKKPLEVSDLLYNRDDTTMEKYIFHENLEEYRMRRKIFTLENTPLLFRSYLTVLFAGNEKETGIEHTFYINEIIQNHTTPQNFIGSVTTRGDTYFVASGSTAFASGATTAGLIAGGAAIAVAAAKIEKNN